MFNITTKQSLNVCKNIIINPVILARTRTTELKIKWQRPKRISRWKSERTGDLSAYVPPDPTSICLKYQYTTELEDAEPNVRNQFTIGWHPLEHSKEFYEKQLMDSVRSHLYDYKSPVAMIAQITGSIRFYQWSIANDLVKSKKRVFYRTEIHRLNLARLEMIKNLRELDYKQYEWLLERLDLEYKPKPERENEIMVSRKEGLRQLTKSYCDDVINKKLEAYRNDLQAQQLPFLKKKLQNLEFIRSEQRALNIQITISQEQIDETRKQYEELKKVHEANKVEPMKKKWKIY